MQMRAEVQAAFHRMNHADEMPGDAEQRCDAVVPRAVRDDATDERFDRTCPARADDAGVEQPLIFRAERIAKGYASHGRFLVSASVAYLSPC